MISFLVETIETITTHFYRAVDLIIQLGLWSVVGAVYAVIGFIIGVAIRKKHDHDSMTAPIAGMLLAFCVLLPLTVYMVG